jgi:hypothetical protein
LSASACASPSSGGSRRRRPPPANAFTTGAKDQEIAQLEEARLQPLAFAAGDACERRREHRELVGLELEQDLRRRITRCGEERRGREPERRREAREHRRAWLLDAARFELGDRAAGDANARGQLGLCESKARTLLAHQPAKARGVGPPIDHTPRA